MTNGARWVQNSDGAGRRAVKQALARPPKLRVERRPFLASKAVIFGVLFTGPHILLVIILLCISKRSHPLDQSKL
jgi:hypothetical protein